MEHFLDDVNHPRFLFLLGDILEENFAHSVMIEVAQWKMDKGRENTVRVNAEDVFEGCLIKNPKRVNVFKSVEIATDDDTLTSDDELDIGRVFGEEEITDHPDQNKRDSHEGTIGKEGIGDHHKKNDSGDNDGSRIGPYMNVLRGNPRKEHAL
jgi:hypothetical protein